MKKLFMNGLICIVSLFLFSEAGAGGPLSEKERTWLKERGTLRIGAFNDYPPFGFVDQSGRPQGMSIDYWRLMSSRLDLALEFHPALFSNQLDGLKNGQYDSLAGIFPLSERGRFFDFSRPYTTIRTNIYVKAKYSHLKDLKELKGLKVGAVEGDSGQVIARRAGLEPLSFSTYLEAILSLAEGETDAIIMDELVVQYFVSNYKLGQKIRKVGRPVDEGQMTLPVKKGNSILLGILNKGINTISSEEWKRIEDEWLGRN
jgi:polar amino acid transport system substrate-binding protein